MQFWNEFVEIFKIKTSFDGCFRDLNFSFFLSIYIHYLGNSVSVPKKPSSKIGQSVDLIRCVMKSNNYGLYIYIFLLHKCTYIYCTIYLLHNIFNAHLFTAQYINCTYIYCTSVKNYLLNLLGNLEIAIS